MEARSLGFLQVLESFVGLADVLEEFFGIRIFGFVGVVLQAELAASTLFDS